jgi:hypothetical protein
MVRLFFAFVLAVIVTIARSSASAATTGATHPPLPPGMTEATFKMLMTPGPPPPAGMPPGVVSLGGCIPTMGYHYANPKNAPFGPIYGAYNGKITFTEIMVDAKLFAQGKSWDDMLKPLPGHTINHVDIWFEPHGHPGYTVPHYDIHAWYVPHEEHMYYCNNKSGTKPAWL